MPTGSLLASMAPVGARRVALNLLDRVREASARIADPNDSEGLHDFRVNVRRLRSILRAYADDLGDTVGKKWRRRLGGIGRATNAGRDTEVQLAWIENWIEEAPAAPDDELGRFVAQLRQRMHHAYSGIDARVVPQFERIDSRLTGRLGHFWGRIDLTGRSEIRDTFGKRNGELMLEHADALWRLLAIIEAVEDRAAIHDARVAGKRLRYLLEPLRDDVPEAKTLVKWLKRLQDILGELNDMHVMLDETLPAPAASEAVPVASSQDPVLTPVGIEAMRRRAITERDARYRAFAGMLADGSVARFIERVHRVGRELISGGQPGALIPRLVLLDRLPTAARRHPTEEIQHGWIVDEHLRDRLTKTTYGEQVLFRRSVEQVGGGAPLDEPMSRQGFESLWRLTRGKRLRLRRYVIRTDEFTTWYVDKVAGRALVLAWTFAAEDAPLEPPDWLAAHLVREVTGDGAFAGIGLAG